MHGKLKVGVIGAGSWAVSSHIPHLASRPEVELTVVNRPEPDLAAKVKDMFGFRHAATDYVDALKHELDIVVVASPSSFHYAHARAALESGAHVLCEKPFTLAAEQAWELKRIADERKRHLVIAFGWNYKPMIVKLKDWMKAEGIGELEAAMVHMASGIRQLLRNEGAYDGAADEFSPLPSTWTDPKLSGGGYAPAQLSHALGLSLWLSGLRGDEVFARTHQAGSQVDLHDAYSIRYTNGAIGTVFGASYPIGEPKHQLEVRLFGENGHLIVDVEREKGWLYRSADDQKHLELKQGDGAYSCEGPVHAIVDLALGKDTVNRSPAELGARTVEIVEAAYKSARNGKPVKIRRQYVKGECGA